MHEMWLIVTQLESYICVPSYKCTNPSNTDIQSPIKCGLHKSPTWASYKLHMHVKVGPIFKIEMARKAKKCCYSEDLQIAIMAVKAGKTVSAPAADFNVPYTPCMARYQACTIESDLVFQQHFPCEQCVGSLLVLYRVHPGQFGLALQSLKGSFA